MPFQAKLDRFLSWTYNAATPNRRRIAGGDPATADVRKRSSAPEYVILGAVTLFLNLDLSAWMHSHSVPPAAIFAVLSLCALASWKVFDGTKQVSSDGGAVGSSTRS